MADNNSPDPPLSGSPGDSQATPVTSPDTHLSGSPGDPQTVPSGAVQPSQSSTRQSRTRTRKASQSDKKEHDPPPKKDSRPPRVSQFHVDLPRLLLLQGLKKLVWVLRKARNY